MYLYYKGTGFVRVSVEQMDVMFKVTYTDLKGKIIYFGDFIGNFVSGDHNLGIPYFDNIKECLLHELSERKRLCGLFWKNKNYKRGMRYITSIPTLLKDYVTAKKLINEKIKN